VKWVSPTETHDLEVISPACEELIATISLGTTADVDRAVAAAKRAFESYSETTLDARLTFLRRIIEVYLAPSSLMCLGARCSQTCSPCSILFFNWFVANDGPQFKEFLESGLAPFAAVARIDGNEAAWHPSQSLI
jgi:Aldehyde dehydrogenase family